jgi:hypothetical protein
VGGLRSGEQFAVAGVDLVEDPLGDVKVDQRRMRKGIMAV